MELVWSSAPEDIFAADNNRDYGEPSQNEFTVVKVEAYNGINSYLGELSNTDMKTVEDVIAYNEHNRGTEGADPGDHPAFPTGQVNLPHLTDGHF